MLLVRCCFQQHVCGKAGLLLLYVSAGVVTVRPGVLLHQLGNHQHQQQQHQVEQQQESTHLWATRAAAGVHPAGRSKAPQQQLGEWFQSPPAAALHWQGCPHATAVQLAAAALPDRLRGGWCLWAAHHHRLLPLPHAGTWTRPLQHWRCMKRPSQPSGPAATPELRHRLVVAPTPQCTAGTAAVAATQDQSLSAVSV